MTRESPTLQRFGPAIIVHGPPLDELLRLALLGARMRRDRDGIETSAATRVLLQTLADAASESGMSPCRAGDVAGHAVSAQWNPMDEITTREAADMLDLSVRQIQRLAPALGGRKRGGVLLVDRDAVAVLAQERQEAGR